MKRFAIIGCGAVAKMHATAIKGLDGGELYGVFDRNMGNAESFAQEYGGKAFSSLEELFSCREVDVVNICTPSGLHAEFALKAANAGKHVIVEKPMAITKSQLDELITVVEKQKIKLTVITQFRFAPSIQRAKKAIDEGRLGKILLADFRGKFYRTDEYYEKGGWRGTWALDGGGALMNQGIHGVDILQYLMGGIKSVSALCTTQDRKIEAEDTAYLIVEYNNGAVGSIHSTTVANPGYPRKIEITGSKGTIKIEEDEIRKWDVVGENESTGRTASKAGFDPMAFSHAYHQLQFQDLIEAIDEDRQPLVDVYEGKKTVEIILAAYESSRAGKKIQLN